MTGAGACLALALASVVGALRCLADHLLPSAAIYTLAAVMLVYVATRVALEAL
jgi:hypothetical protein